MSPFATPIPSRRRGRRALPVAFLVAAILYPATTIAAAGARQDVHCPGLPGGDCRKVTVALDHRHPENGRTTEVIYRVDAARGERLGTLVVAVGGPGVRGLSEADPWLGLADPAIRDHYDIVFFDQRGVGGSGGPDCGNAVRGLPRGRARRPDRSRSRVRAGLPGRARRCRGPPALRLDLAGGSRRRRDPGHTRARSDRAVRGELRHPAQPGLCRALSRPGYGARARWRHRSDNDRSAVLAGERARVSGRAGCHARGLHGGSGLQGGRGRWRPEHRSRQTAGDRRGQSRPG